MEQPDGASSLELGRVLGSKKAMFFAGSGISIPSGVPAADAIIRASKSIFLPKNPLAESIVRRIQPEKFYERLLELTHGDRKRLALWKAVAQPFEPNFNHYFLVQYSVFVGAPLFTTNFDTLFEEAAKRMSIDVNPLDRTSDFAKPLDSEKLNLVKLHGTIGSDKNLASIYTTTTEISRFNPSVIDFIQSQMESRALTIVGYSGRDLDHFPFIVEKSKDPKVTVYWINRFAHKKRIDYQNALSIGSAGARIIFSYPNKYLKSLRFSEKHNLDQLPHDVGIEKIQLAKKAARREMWRLKKEALEGLEWGGAQKLLFLGSLLEAIGRYRPSQSILEELKEPRIVATLTPPQRFVLFRVLCNDAHNLSEFTKLRPYAQQLQRIPVADDRLGALFKIVGIVFEAEYNRMLVPYMSFIYSDFASRLFRGRLLESIQVGTRANEEIANLITNFGLGGGLEVDVERGSHNEVFQVQCQQEVLEHQVRLLIMEQQLVKDFVCLPPNATTQETLRSIDSRWTALRDTCYRQGYYAGVANCHRHRQRTVTSETQLTADLERAKSITIVTNLETTRHLVDQQWLEFHMRCGRVDNVVKVATIKRLLKGSLKLENHLNTMKSFLALLEYDRLTGKEAWSFRTDYQRRKVELDRETEGGITKTLTIIKRANPLWYEYLTWLKSNSSSIDKYFHG